jgi:L-seryl-tRNA(Ser) seleniumtransferase
MSTQYRHLPAVEVLVQAVESSISGAVLPRHLLIASARIALTEARTQIASGSDAPNQATLIEQVYERTAAALQPSIRPVINATGVIIHTNLGRAPLSTAAIAAMQAVGSSYSNLEYSLEAGERGSRYTHLTKLLCQLTGAEAAIVVNNNAAAIYLTLSALALGREVIVSRGQAVEIGGGFRIPDVLRQSGARLVEVGTTNRTYASDYQAAITPETALLMRIHTSNFRMLGFTHETTLAELAEVAHNQHNLLVVDDLGSGTLLPTAPYGLTAEPTIQESVTAGADLVTFSGDKLLGGPQAGLIVGRKQAIAQLQRHPLMRALRVDKTTLAGLEATLLAYLRGTAHSEIPVWQMISTPLEALHERAGRLREQIGTGELIACMSAIGGGSLPGETIPSVALALDLPQVDRFAYQLRLADTAVVTRIHEGRVILDLRTVLPMQDQALVQAIQSVSTAWPE